VIKFLRRTQPEEPGVSEHALKVYEGLKIPKTRELNFPAIASAVRKKIDILQNREKKLKMLRTIATLRMPWVPVVLFDLLDDPNEEIRDIAVRELARRDDWPVEKAYQRLGRPPWYAKSAILKILSRKKCGDAVLHIMPLLNDPNVDVRRCAAEALGEIGGLEARALLVRLAKDRNLYVRRVAQDALDKVCDLKFS